MKNGSSCNMQPRAVAASDKFCMVLLTNAAPMMIALRNVTPNAQLTNLAANFVSVVEKNEAIQPFVETLLEAELEATDNTGTLLRSNSLVSKTMTAFVRLPENMAYLRTTLCDPIVAVTKMKVAELEINPEFARINTNLNANMDRFRSIVKMFVEAIYNSAASFPSEARQLCSMIRSKCSAKFSEASLQPVGNVIILRFITPAIVTPEEYGFTHELTPDVHRILLCVSKCIQNLCNGTECREEFMKPLNDFIRGKKSMMDGYLDAISTDDNTDRTRPASRPDQITDEEFYSAVQSIAGMCRENMDVLKLPKELVEEDEAKNVMAIFKQLIQEMEVTGAIAAKSGAAARPGRPGKNPGAAQYAKTMKTLQRRTKELQKLEEQAVKKRQRADPGTEIMRPRKEVRDAALLLAGESMCEAASCGNIRELKQLISRNKKFVNAKNKNGETLLHCACMNEQSDTVRFLLENDADCFLADNCGCTALHAACMAGNLNIVMELCIHNSLDYSAVNDDENTPLHYLVRIPYQPMMENILVRFLAGGADINAQNVIMETPLHNAVWKSNNGAISMLLRHGANPLLCNTKRASPLDWARLARNTAAVEMIEKSILEPTIVPDKQPKVYSMASQFAQLTPVQRHEVIWQYIREDKEDAVMELLRFDKSLATQTYGAENNTLLHVAAMYGNLRLVQRLLFLREAPCNAFDTKGNNALMKAMWMGNVEVVLVMLLSQRVFDVDKKYPDGNCLIHLAAKDSSDCASDIVFALAERGADVNARNNSFDTPLMLAVRIGSIKTVRTLLDVGADKSLKNKNGDTALSFAIKYAHSTLISMLDPEYYRGQISSISKSIM